MKKIKIFAIIIFLLILLAYITNITSIPDNIILFKGENINLQTMLGIEISEKSNSYEIIQTSSNIKKDEIIESQNLQVSLLNILPLKQVKVSVIPKASVVPVGGLIGLKLYTDGVLVVGMSEIDGSRPYENTGIQEGDMITHINDKEISSTDELIETVNSSNDGKVNLKYEREGTEYFTSMQATKTAANQYKLGLWVRDAAAGIGTVTYYEPSTGNFAALGHGIVDIDTEKLVTIASGEITTARIVSIAKGEKGKPGEIKGSIVNQIEVGKISKNTDLGIYGILNNLTAMNIDTSQQYEVALRDEIREGNAKVLCTLENGVKEEFEIEIEKIYKKNNYDNKSMLIKITDKRLIEKTGGIIQRNERSTYNTKWKIYRSDNTCACKLANKGLRSIWGFNDKRNERR
jgi:stage IV sporulation protein B